MSKKPKQPKAKDNKAKDVETRRPPIMRGPTQNFNLKTLSQEKLLQFLNNEYGTLIMAKQNIAALNAELLLRIKETEDDNKPPDGPVGPE
jgi:hypothetical protein